MHVPSADELAAIAAAYLAVSRRDEHPAPAAEGPRWRLAGRVASPDAQRARFAARTISRWSAAGRLGG